MSSLGLSLLILIVVAIGALAAYNFWLTRKPSARSGDFDTGFSSGHTTRQEPSFSSGVTEPHSPEASNPSGEVASSVSAPSVPAPSVPASPLTSFGSSPAPTDSVVASDQTSNDNEGLTKPELAKKGASDWSAGVLPAVPPAPPPPDLNWQSGPAAEPAQVAQPGRPTDAQSGTSSTFEASIEQAMRLQQEADEVIDSAPSPTPAEDGVADGGPGPELAEPPFGVPADADSQAADELASAAPGQTADQTTTQRDEPDGPPKADEAPISAPELPLEVRPEEPTESSSAGESSTPVPGDAIGGSDTQDPVEAAQVAATAGKQAEPPAPGWSGIDSDRQAANFVATVNVELSSPSKGAELIARTRELTHAGTKPVRITAGNPPATGQTAIQTEPIHADRDYALLRFELLQVNRHGPLDGVEYSSFVAAVDAIGEALGVLVNPPDMNVVLIKSRVLDAEVASLDAQVAVNVETEEAISSEKFVSLAQEIGMAKHDLVGANDDVNADVYAATDDGGYVIYTAQLNSEANRIVLVLDVPAVPRELQPVRKMVEGAWAFAQALNGQMIDDNGRAIDNALFERIESQIETHYQALLAAGVPAGSDLARQVYNQV